MIIAESLIKYYDVGGEIIRALDDVSIRIESGEMVAITGASGSGKSTLMNIMGCLDRPDSGKYYIGEDDVSHLSANRLAQIRNKHIGFIFQSFNLLPRLSALENVELPLLYAGHREAKEKAMAAIRIVGLEDRRYHEPNQLSGGQRQRVAIARAIVTDPSLILADEPTGNLDSHTSVEIMAILKDLNEKGRTIILVTHEADIAAYCKRRVHMKDGKIVSQ